MYERETHWQERISGAWEPTSYIDARLMKYRSGRRVLLLDIVAVGPEMVERLTRIIGSPGLAGVDERSRRMVEATFHASFDYSPMGEEEAEALRTGIYNALKGAARNDASLKRLMQEGVTASASQSPSL